MRSTLLSVFAVLVFSAYSYGASPPQVALPDFTQIVSQAAPSVVTVYVTTPALKDRELPPFLVPKDGKLPKGVPPDLFSTPEDPKEEHKETPKEQHSSGSGFIISSNGLILTNNHVVQDSTKIVVLMKDNHEYKAQIVGTDPMSDVAVIKVETSDLQPIKIGHSSEVKQGQWVLGLGSPFGFEGTLTVGIVSAVNRYLNGQYSPFIQTDAAINHGNSGGPLLNLSGEVIGINSRIYSGTGDFSGLAFSIPIDMAMDIEKQLVQSGHVTRSKMGIVVAYVDQEKADKLGLSRPKGGVIVGFDKTGPAAAAGIKVDDVILSVNDTPIEISAELPLLISNLKPGTTSSLSIWRDKKLIALNVEVTEAEDSPKLNPEK